MSDWLFTAGLPDALPTLTFQRNERPPPGPHISETERPSPLSQQVLHKISKIGLSIFTFRNGNFYLKDKYPKAYAEKLLYVMDGQILPYHYHWYKREDIINRGGGDLEITMYNSTPEDYADQEGGRGDVPGTFSDTDVDVKIDGKTLRIPAGGKVILHPGQSVSIAPGQYHQWQGVPGTGDVILFEVSSTNDDNIDNRFYRNGDRIPDV